MRWFTSDWHFWHRNVIQYCNRPFSSVEEMNEALVKIWNSTVKPEDEVHFIGDFSLSPRSSALYAPILHGTKYLYSGNHDATFPKHKKSEKFISKYKQDGWTDIFLTKELTLKNNINVLLSHLPYAPSKDTKLEFDLRYMNYRPENKGMFLIHGHLHGKYKKFRNMLDVGIDAHDLKLVSEDEVIEFMNSKEEFIPSSITEFYKNRNGDSAG